MRSLLAKEQHGDSYGEENIVASIPNDQEAAQKFKLSGGAKQLDNVNVAETVNNSETLQLLQSFQKMREEEQRLIEQKQHLLTKQFNLQSALVKQMEKMKASIVNLNSEIPELENKIQKLEETLGLPNGTEAQLPNMNSRLSIPEGDEALPDCVGLINCSKPEKCLNYDSCLKNYVAAEIRNEIPRL